MRVITGSARGKKLLTLEGLDVRPTISKVKEAVFSSLQFEIQGREILDLFAGSGQLGIEALSRDAKHCCFVDNSKKSLKVITENLSNCKFENKSTVFAGDAISFLNQTDKTFDIAFLDPPYNKGILQSVLPKLVEKMSPYGVIVCEHHKDDVLEEKYSDFVCVKQAKYSTVYVTYYRKEG